MKPTAHDTFAKTLEAAREDLAVIYGTLDRHELRYLREYLQGVAVTDDLRDDAPLETEFFASILERTKARFGAAKADPGAAAVVALHGLAQAASSWAEVKRMSGAAALFSYSDANYLSLVIYMAWEAEYRGRQTKPPEDHAVRHAGLAIDQAVAEALGLSVATVQLAVLVGKNTALQLACSEGGVLALQTLQLSARIAYLASRHGGRT